MKYIITIPEPCNENWDAMTPTEKGRFCSSCEKEVLDFTNTSNYSLAGLLDKNEKICGRFRASQLNKELNSNKNTRIQRTGLVFGIGSLLSLCTPVVAQENPKPIELPIKVGKPLILKGNNSELNPSKIQGTVIDQDDMPLPGASIIIQGTTIGAQTDFDGNFHLDVPKDAFESNKKLVISYIGFETKEICLNKLEPKIRLELTLPMTEVFLGGMVVVKKRNIFNRIASLFKKNPKHEIEEPKEMTCELDDGSTNNDIVKIEDVQEPMDEVMEESKELKSTMVVWPNPATEELRLKYTMDVDGSFNAQLIPLNKNSQQTILLAQGNRQKGKHQEVFQVANVKDGLYVLVVNANGNLEKHKIFIDEK